MASLFYQGHGSYRIITNEDVVIYVDPFFNSDYSKEADLILVTHEHYDHNNVDLVSKKEDCIVIRQNNLKNGTIYNSTSVKGIGIEAVEAYNKCHDKSCCVGYILRFDDLVIYASGDTSITEDMKNKLPKYNIDYALLPIDGIYNMNPEEASEAAKMIKAKHCIPIHMKPMDAFNKEMADRFKPKNRQIVPAGYIIEL